jgi:hypothetical protein
MKRFLIIGATALLCACGGQQMVAHAPIGTLVRPGIAPWLTVSDAQPQLEVRGLDHKLYLEPTPALSAAVQSQLGSQLSGYYFSNLVVTCTALTAEVRVDQDKAPGEAAMDMGLHCSFWARGFDTSHDYKTRVSTAVASGAGDQGYVDALPTLVANSSADIAKQMRDDLQHLKAG